MPRSLSLARALTLLAFLVAPFAAPETAEAATMTVNVTDDTTGDGCTAAHCSLREAVAAANLTTLPDTISFSIPGAGPRVILLAAPLTLSQPSTIIAGETQPGFAGRPLIVIDGSAVDRTGFWVPGEYSAIRNLSLIHFEGGGVAAVSLVGAHSAVENCFVGINADGTAAGNTIGVRLEGDDVSVTGSFIGGNQTGIRIGGSSRVVVQRNRIGLNADGGVVANAIGIRLQHSAASALIGGDGPEDRNVISGSSLYGIQDDSTPMGGHVIAYNYIGTDARGTSAVANAVGVYRFAPDAAGSLTLHDNLVSGNGTGIWLNGYAHVVENNWIGVDYLGALALPNAEVGLRLEGCDRCVVEDNVISGNPVGLLLADGPGGERETLISVNRIGYQPDLMDTIPNGIGIQVEGGERTVISGNFIGGNDTGLQLNAGQATVRGNSIGSHGPAPNGAGIRIGIGFSPSTIGGTRESDGNLVAYNLGDGIHLLGGGHVIMFNEIYSNGGHGVHIDAGMAEPSAAGLGNVISVNRIYDNDGLGIRVEAPELVGGLEPPELSSVTTTTVTGTAAPNSLVEVFLAAPDPTYYGEGMTYLAQRSAGTDGSFTITFPDTGSCPIYTATATDSHGNTSEFSRDRSTCARLPPLVGIGILIGMAAGGSAFTLVIRRRPPDLRSAPGIALGALVGLGLGLLFLALPSVQLNWGGEDRGATPIPGAANLPFPVTLTPIPTTLTPAPVPDVMARENANCRQGPSTQFNVATHLLQGQVVPITGRLTEGGWWQVQPPDQQIPCWVSESVVEPNGDLSAVTVVIPPAPPTITPTEEPASGCMCYNQQTKTCVHFAQCPSYCPPCP